MAENKIIYRANGPQSVKSGNSESEDLGTRLGLKEKETTKKGEHLSMAEATTKMGSHTVGMGSIGASFGLAPLSQEPQQYIFTLGGGGVSWGIGHKATQEAHESQNHSGRDKISIKNELADNRMKRLAQVVTCWKETKYELGVYRESSFQGLFGGLRACTVWLATSLPYR